MAKETYIYTNRHARHQRILAGGPEERRSRSRRVFLYIIVGASIGGLIADLVNIVYQVLNAALQGTFGGRVLHDSVWSLQSLFVAAPLLWYHWRIVRADQRAGAELIVKRKTVTLLAVDPDGAIAERLSKRLGYRVRPLQMAGGQAEQSAIPDDEIERAAADIEQAPTPAIMVVLSEGKITVYPYRER